MKELTKLKKEEGMYKEDLIIKKSNYFKDFHFELTSLKNILIVTRNRIYFE